MAKITGALTLDSLYKCTESQSSWISSQSRFPKSWSMSKTPEYLNSTLFSFGHCTVVGVHSGNIFGKLGITFESRRVKFDFWSYPKKRQDTSRKPGSMANPVAPSQAKENCTHVPMSNPLRLKHSITGLKRQLHSLQTSPLARPNLHDIRYHSDSVKPKTNFHTAMASAAPNPTTTSPKNVPSNRPPDASLKDKVQLAENQDPNLILTKLSTLLTPTTPNPHPWHLCLNGKGIQRSFHFKTFKQTWDFMDSVAEECKAKRHHPEWWNVRIPRAKFNC